MEQDLEHLLGRTLAGFYLTHLLGSGGMAVVFRGENAINRKLVRSIKIVRPEFADDPEFRARFASEAMILERLHHPNVVGFFGLREDSFDDEPFLVMELEYLEGHTLSTVLLRSTVTPPITEIARWMLDASEGVAAAHARSMSARMRSICALNAVSTARTISARAPAVAAAMSFFLVRMPLTSAITSAVRIIAPTTSPRRTAGDSSMSWLTIGTTRRPVSNATTSRPPLKGPNTVAANDGGSNEAS